MYSIRVSARDCATHDLKGGPVAGVTDWGMEAEFHPLTGAPTPAVIVGLGFGPQGPERQVLSARLDGQGLGLSLWRAKPGVWVPAVRLVLADGSDLTLTPSPA